MQEFGVGLSEREVELKGGAGVWKVDVVSPDGRIVGEIKTGRYNCKPPMTKITHLYETCFILLATKSAET